MEQTRKACCFLYNLVLFTHSSHNNCTASEKYTDVKINTYIHIYVYANIPLIIVIRVLYILFMHICFITHHWKSNQQHAWCIPITKYAAKSEMSICLYIRGLPFMFRDLATLVLESGNWQLYRKVWHFWGYIRTQNVLTYERYLCCLQ